MKFEPSIAAPDTQVSASDPPPTARFTLDQPPFAGQSFVARLHVCPNPCCPCGFVGFECRAETAPGLSPRCFDLDLSKRELANRRGSAPEGVALGRAFLAEAQEPEWAWLCEFFYVAKRRQMATMDLDTLAVDLPADFQDDAGTMVSYRDVFPWAEMMKFTHGGSEWFAQDQYCARPGCTCTEVGLGCFQLPAGDQPSAEPLESATFLFLDYVTGKTRVDEAEPGSPGPDALLQSLRAAHSDLAGILLKRHGELQHLGRRVVDSSGRQARRAPFPLDDATEAWLTQPPPPQIARALARPGRNAPCPCGSGKKFKKCCGAAGQPRPR